MSLGYTGSGEVFPGVHSACFPIQLPAGTIYARDTHVDIGPNSCYITPYCPMDSLYIYDLSRVFRDRTHILTASTKPWQDIYLDHGGYSSSLPVFISIVTFALGIVLSLASFMTMSQHSRFPWLLKFTVYYACAVVVAVFSQVLSFMHSRYHLGGNSVMMVVTHLLVPRFQIPSYIASVLLLFSLGRVAERLFERSIERRVVRFLAPVIITVALVMGGTSMFSPVANPVVGALRYLFELSIYVLFSICVCLRAVEVWPAAFSRELHPLTCLTILTTWMPCALYFADAYGWWQARIIDELCPFSTLSCVVLGWYWVQRLGDIQQGIAADRHLGRRIYDLTKEEQLHGDATRNPLLPFWPLASKAKALV